MRRSLLPSEKGLTIIELLACLALMGIVSVILIHYLTSGMNSFRKVNEEISIHDEANYIMRLFENEILVATSVEDVPNEDLACDGSSNCNLIKITKINRDSDSPITTSLILGFKEHQAFLNGTVIHASRFKVLNGPDESLISIIQNPNKKENTVSITLVMEDTLSSSEYTVQLESHIPFIKVD